MFSLVVAISLSAAAAGDIEDLAAKLPSDSNTVAVVRVQDILESPRAVREGWKDKQKSEFLAGSATIPHFVDTIVMGSLVLPARSEEVWSAALVTLPFPLEMGMVAGLENSYVEKLGSIEAVHSQDGAYFLKVDESTAGVLAPASRQGAVRWARKMAENTGLGLDRYLNDAVRQPGHLVIAMDLRDMFEPRRVRERLELIESADFDPSGIDKMVDLLAGMRGIRMSATVGETTQAVISMDFSDNVGSLAPQLKAVFLELISDQQAFIEDFESAEVESLGEVVQLRVQLADASLRKIVTLLVAPHPKNSQEVVATSETPAPSTPLAEVTPKENVPTEPGTPDRAAVDFDKSKDYYKKVQDAIEDLSRANRKAKDYARTATWHDNFADKIEKLPITGVDPMLVDYGTRVASQFRALAASLRGVAVDVNSQQRAVVYDVQYNPGYIAGTIWGGGGYRPDSYQVNSNLREVRERQAQAVAAGEKDRVAIWQIIDDERSDLRRKMFDKYGVDMDDPKSVRRR